MKETARNLGVWALAAGFALLLLSTVLPWLSKNGYAGEVVQRNYLDNIDATPLFYTECERTAEIVRNIDPKRTAHGR